MALNDNLINSPLINTLRVGSENDPYHHYVDVLYKVVNQKVQLNEIPDTISKVQVKNPSNLSEVYYEVQNSSPSQFQYVVDYVNGIVTTGIDSEGKTLAFTWQGRGASFLPIDRVWTQQENGIVTETLGEIVQAGRDGIENIYILNDLVDTTTAVRDDVTYQKESYKYDPNDYSASKQYKVNNQVTYNGKTYICIQNTNGHSPVDVNYWRIFASGADSLRRSKVWITTEGMTDFDISDTGRYAIGTYKLEVVLGGAPQINGVNFDEVTPTLFRFKSPLPAGLRVFARWFDGDIGTATGHNAQHRKGGGDELNIGDLAGITEFISKYINPYGTTSQRPTGSNLYLGMKYFDTTLNIPIYYSGSNWRKYSDNSIV